MIMNVQPYTSLFLYLFLSFLYLLLSFLYLFLSFLYLFLWLSNISLFILFKSKLFDRKLGCKFLFQIRFSFHKCKRVTNTRIGITTLHFLLGLDNFINLLKNRKDVKRHCYNNSNLAKDCPFRVFLVFQVQNKHFQKAVCHIKEIIKTEW